MKFPNSHSYGQTQGKIERSRIYRESHKNRGSLASESNQCEIENSGTDTILPVTQNIYNILVVVSIPIMN